MKDLESKDILLKELITYLSRGHYEIPDFQRKFEWDPNAIDDLMRSIFLDQYIGSLLLWEGGNNFDSLSCEPISGHKGANERTHIVLDGQQRLSAIYYAFFAPNELAPKKKHRSFHFIQIDRLMDEDYEGAFKHRSQAIPYELPKDQYENHCFPLSILGKGGMDMWLDEYGEQYRDYGKKFKQTIRDVLNNYKISYIELGQNLEIDKICAIFTKINSTGIKLDIFDLMNALLKPKGVLLKQEWQKVEKEDFKAVNFRHLNIYVLQVMSILLQNGSCSPKYLRNLVPKKPRPSLNDDKNCIDDSEEFMRHWKESVDAIKQALLLLSSGFGAIVPKFIPYPAILPVFAALNLTASRQPKYNQNKAFDKVRRWYWASVFTNRYGSAVATKTARDYKEVHAWMEGGPIPEAISNFPPIFANLRLREFNRQNAAIYNGVINLIVLEGAKDWFTGLDLIPGSVDDHHIVPKSWGKKHLDTEKEIDTILNRTPISPSTNRSAIGSSLPHEYLPELIARNGEVAVRGIFDSHLIPEDAFNILLTRNPFTPDDFREFIAARESAILSKIERLRINPGG